jgi:ferritin-like protein
MAATALHESADDLTTATREMHRALASLMEELEAVDWYGQRIDACQDEELARVLAHNRDEEKEHACMTIEWIRRHDSVFDRQLRRFLFRSGPIAEVEAHGEDGPPAAPASLGIGSLRDEEER